MSHTRRIYIVDFHNSTKIEFIARANCTHIFPLQIARFQMQQFETPYLVKSLNIFLHPLEFSNLDGLDKLIFDAVK